MAVTTNGGLTLPLVIPSQMHSNALGWSNALFTGSQNLSHQEVIQNDEGPGGDIYIPSTTANDVNLEKDLPPSHCLYSVHYSNLS